MSITITLGKSGRIVVPKSVRDLLHLREGSRLRLDVVVDKLEVTPEADEVRMEKRFPSCPSSGWDTHLSLKLQRMKRMRCRMRFSMICSPTRRTSPRAKVAP